jgi:guanosine-3',5'-bis(diphosphate) 3'-pyrophosphohydrolase
MMQIWLQRQFYTTLSRIQRRFSANWHSIFNADIAGLVAEVTDDKRLDKAERKRLQVEHASAKTARAKILKLADKISNLRSLARSPPADWSLERKSEYLSWSRDVVQGLRGASAWLEARFDEAAETLECSLRSS